MASAKESDNTIEQRQYAKIEIPVCSREYKRVIWQVKEKRLVAETKEEQINVLRQKYEERQSTLR